MKTKNTKCQSQVDLLKAVMEHERVTEEEVAAFTSMMIQVGANGRSLSDKQLQWLHSVALRLDITEPCHNLMSDGQIPRGAEVPTPAILLNRPLKPPGK